MENKDAWQSYYDEHKAAADRILSCEPSHPDQILEIGGSATPQDVHKAFCRLSNLLSPEGSKGNPQYELAQEAHDRLWKAARSYGVDMKQYYGDNENPPVFPTSNNGSGANGVKSAEDDSLLQCVHCRSSYARPPIGGDSSKTFIREYMDTWIDEITACDPKDYVQVMDVGRPGQGKSPELEQVNLNFKFIQRAFWVSPYTMPYWEAGEYFEKQKKVFDILYQAGKELGVDEKILAEYKCILRPASPRP